MKERLGAEHYGAERQETVAAHAEGLVRAELKRRHWTEADWAHRPKGDARQVALAVRLRAETTVTVRWIAERLHMGAPGYVHHLLPPVQVVQHMSLVMAACHPARFTLVFRHEHDRRYFGS